MRNRGKVFVVTGASSGIGLATAEILVGDGATVVMVSRHPRRAARALERVRGDGMGQAISERTDFASLSAVRELAERIRGRFERIDALINNAGILCARRAITPDGLETTMAVNHAAPFLLSELLIEQLVRARGRIVNVSSDAHRIGDLRRAPVEDVLRGRAWRGMIKAYADSKLANVLFTFEWARRKTTTGVIANSLHPGVLNTRVWNHNLHPLSIIMQPFRPFMGHAVRGATAVRELAQPGSVDDGGRYFDKNRPVRAAEQAYDRELAAELWSASARLAGLSG